MNKNEIDAFLQISRLNSITKAAEVLYITQPALSRRIQQLESKLGYSLFLRKKGCHTLELTEQGQEFLNIAQKLKKIYEESSSLQSLSFKAYLNFSAVNSIATNLVPIACDMFLRKFPDIKLGFKQNSSFEIYNNIEGSRLDFGLVAESRYSRAVSAVPIFSERFCIIANKDFSPKDMLTMDELNPQQELWVPWNQEVDAWHEYWLGTTCRPQLSTTTLTLLPYLLTHQKTWALMTVSNASYIVKTYTDLKIYDMESPPPERLIYLLHKKSHKSELVRNFIESMLEYASSIDEYTCLLDITDGDIF